MAEEIIEEIKEIVIQRPDLTPEEWLIVEKAAPYYKALLKPEVRQELEVEFAKKLAAIQAQMTEDTKQMVQERFDEWRKSQEPLGTADLKKLLSQEYATYEMTVFDMEQKKQRVFTIRELPKSVEARFIDILRRAIVPLLEEKQWKEFVTRFDSSFAEKIQAILDMVPNSLDLLCELVAICLDPFKTDGIDGKWVADNLSLKRIQAVIFVQVDANKYRDFFLQGFRWYQTLRAA
jgi:hypothetical protein